MNWKAVAAMGAVAALGVGGYVLFDIFGSPRTATIGEILRQNGFTEFKPPTRHALPGTLVLITETEPVALGVVCRPEQALGLTLADIPMSPSAATDLTAALSRTLELDAGLMARLKAAGKLDGVEDIKITLGNVRILELSDDDVIRGLSKRDAACAAAVRLRLEAGQPLTMIKSALMADVTYTATTRTQAAGDLSLDLREELAASLTSRVSGSDAGTITLTGQNLVWGIRDDQVLAMLGTTLPATGIEAGGLPERRLLSAESAVEVVDLER